MWRGPKQQLIIRWFSATLQYLQYISNGDIAVLHKAIKLNFETVSQLHVWNVGNYIDGLVQDCTKSKAVSRHLPD